MQELRRERHSVSRLVVHLVCVTKYRRKVLDGAAIAWMQTHCANVCERMGAQLLALDGESDHIHLSVEYPPKVSVSALVNALKGTSSRVLRRLRPDIGRRYWKGVLWSPSYFAASTGPATLEKVKQYVEAQRASPVP
jgi:putative transposase